MKKILVPLLVLALLCAGLAALAEGEAVSIELITAKLPFYEAGDPFLEGFLTDAEQAEGMQVLVLPVRRSIQLQIGVAPKTVRNKKVTLAVDNEEIVRVKGYSVTGLQPGQTVLTITSAEDPSVTLSCVVAVIQQVNRISLTASEKSVPVGGTITLTPAFTPEETTRKQVTWSSANENVATVDDNGNVTGVRRGSVRIVATAADGSNIRANINVNVTQNAEEIVLDKPEVTVDVGRNTMLRATVLPKDTNDKSVVWSSSDESIATVNGQGRVTGVALGDCEIICASKIAGEVQAKAVVHVQQPVQSIAFADAPVIYAGETGTLTWTVEPANASNPALTFTSGNKNILSVAEDGTVTGLKAGDAFVTAATTDGSNRRARVKVRIYQHVEKVQMRRQNAYIELGTSDVTGADLFPKNLTNPNMTWEIADPDIASAEGLKKQPNRVNIKGLAEGTTTLTGTTEDGGLQTSLTVHVGHYEQSLKFDKKSSGFNGKGQLILKLENVSDLLITSVQATVTVVDKHGNPVPVNAKDGSNTFTMVYNQDLESGKKTRDEKWKVIDYEEPEDPTGLEFIAQITEFQIDHDWIMMIRKRYQPTLSFLTPD